MATPKWVLIEHGDHRDARELMRGSYRQLFTALQSVINERIIRRCSVEKIVDNVWMCHRYSGAGPWIDTKNSTVLRLITVAEWETYWLPLQAEWETYWLPLQMEEA